MKNFYKIIIFINLVPFLTSIFFLPKLNFVIIRQLLTGEFIADTINNSPNEIEVNKKIKSLYKYGDKSLIKNVFDKNKRNNIKYLIESSKVVNCRVPTDHPKTVLTKTDCLARGIALEVSPFFTGKECGLNGSIINKINNVYKGIGCCSDFNQSFMLHAAFAGLKVREVSNVSHTGAEYFDPEINEWKWIDTSYRTQISNNEGEIISAYKIYNMSVDQPLFIVNTYPIYKIRKDIPYNRIADKGEVTYTLFDNIIEREELLNKLLKFKIPKLIAEFITLKSQGLFKSQYLVIGGGLRGIGLNFDLLKTIFFLNIICLVCLLISLIVLSLRINNYFEKG